MKRLFFISLLSLYSLSLMAQEYKIRSKVDSIEITIGDQMNMDIYVDVPNGSQVAFPHIKDTLTAQIELVEASIVDTTVTDSGTTFHQRLVLTSFDTGYMAIPGIPVIIDQDTNKVLISDIQQIYVSDVVVNMEAEIMDIKEPKEVPFNWWAIMKWVLLVLAISALIGGIGYFLWRKKKEKEGVVFSKKPKIPAHEIALKRLEEIRAAKLWQNDQAKQFHVEVSEAVRQYIEDRYHLDALEQTTDEIMESLKSVQLNNELKTEIRKSLQLADLVKFAKVKPLADENERSLETAFNFVRTTLIMPLDESSEEENPTEENAG
ncbi:MAG: hypothetical protein ACI9P8_000637 [Bacteroidia bacterium]|jgi:hypothetical protein